MSYRPRSKYGAVRTEVDGHTFASKKEAKRYGELKLLEKAGEIRNVQMQPRFYLWAPGGDMDSAIGEAMTRIGSLSLPDFRKKAAGE